MAMAGVTMFSFNSSFNMCVFYATFNMIWQTLQEIMSKPTGSASSLIDALSFVLAAQSMFSFFGAGFGFAGSEFSSGLYK